jgi:hypothetical protein
LQPVWFLLPTDIPSKACSKERALLFGGFSANENRHGERFTMAIVLI